MRIMPKAKLLIPVLAGTYLTVTKIVHKPFGRYKIRTLIFRKKNRKPVCGGMGWGGWVERERGSQPDWLKIGDGKGVAEKGKSRLQCCLSKRPPWTLTLLG